MRIFRFTWLYGLGLGIVLPASAQTNPSDTPAYLLRMERTRGIEAVCILVRSDGPYHLERSTWDKTEVFEGGLPSGEVQKIEHWVGADELFTLTQDRIVAPLFRESKDELVLAVNRPGHWQSLRFPASTTREPYQQSVVPLVQWFDEILKAKHARRLREEEARNNCIPPHQLKLSTRPSPQAQAEALPRFIFILRTNRFEGKQGMHSCSIVYPDGRYHRETKSQKLGNKSVSAAVYEGALGEADIDQVKSILASPDMQNRTAQLPPGGEYMSDGEITFVTVPDAAKPRTTTFWRYAPGPFQSRQRLEESGMKALEPLNQWLKSNVESPSATPIANGSFNECIPEKLP